MITRDDMALDNDALFCRMLEESFFQLRFECLRFWLEKSSITINGKDTSIIVCVPSFVNEKPRPFSFFKERYPIRDIRLSETSKIFGFPAEFNERLDNIRNNVEELVAYVCLIVSGSIALKPLDIRDIVNDNLSLDGIDVLSVLTEGVHPSATYYPIDYDEDTLREMGVTGMKLDILSMDFGFMDDSFIIAFAKHHLASLSHQSTVRALEYIKQLFLRNIKWGKEYAAIDYDLNSGIALKEQEWLFHLQCVFQVYSDYFTTAEECSMRDRVLNYCKSRICDLKPAKLTQATANANGNSFSDKILVDVYKWLVERGHIAVQGADEEESLNHFIYITSGRNEDLVSPEMRKQRVKWIGKDKFIFVTFIKEIHGGTDDKNREPYIEWSEVPNQFDVDFGEPLNGAFARKVTRNECYKQRYTSRIRGHVDVRDLILVFRPETK